MWDYIWIGLFWLLIIAYWVGYLIWKSKKRKKHHISKGNILVNSYIIGIDF